MQLLHELLLVEDQLAILITHLVGNKIIQQQFELRLKLKYFVRILLTKFLLLV